MPSDSFSSRNQVDSNPSGADPNARLAIELLHAARSSMNAREYLRQSLAGVRQSLSASYAGVVALAEGGWSVVGHAGPQQSLPADLLAEVLDRRGPAIAPPWLAAPLAIDGQEAQVLAARLTTARMDPAGVQKCEALASALATGLAIAREREAGRRRIERLEAVLMIVARWNQSQDMQSLLEQMAQAATRLLECDRATIFLWDRENRQLVGRPALGLPGGELRIGDDVGLVGQVVRSGRPGRVDAAAAPGLVERRVDAQTGYETRSLLCVPLLNDREIVGAFEVINKREGSFTDEDERALLELAAHAAVALENTQEREQLLAAHRQMTEDAAAGVQLVGESAAVDALRSTVRRVAQTDLAVLILGENGTGKEVVARLVHFLGRRRERPFVAVNCAAIAETLLESELFGHERGAFTDAREARPGKFELAGGGTLFLDEIGDLSLAGQAKLLRVLEEKVVVRVGGSTPIYTDVRVIAATNQDLAELVRRKKFREDLYFRLGVVTLTLPPLRARGDDILVLAEHFLREFSRRARRKTPKLSAAARKRLLLHDWPGNVRELRNLMERLAYLHSEDRIEAEDLLFLLSPDGADSSEQVPLGLALSEATEQFQTNYIRQTIERSRGNMTETAERLGLHRSNLYRKMRQLGMPIE